MIPMMIFLGLLIRMVGLLGPEGSAVDGLNFWDGVNFQRFLQVVKGLLDVFHRKSG